MLNNRIAGRRMKRITVYLDDRLRTVREAREESSRRIVMLETRAADLKRATRIKDIAVNELGMKLPEGAPVQLY